MKERPILFSGPMVRAILEGRKTQTRRAVKPQPEVMYDYKSNPEMIEFCHETTSGTYSRESFARRCPHGTVGDRLWVRECFGTTAAVPTSTAKDEFAFLGQPELFAYRADNPSGRWCWNPSIHMPRWASRITLEITGVRVERLQDISEADARAEGVDTMRDMQFAVALGNIHAGACRLNFIDLWQSINGPESWSANPWVWVIEFRKLNSEERT